MVPVPSLPLDTIIQGDALEVIRTLPDASVDLILTDPPYFKVKNGEAWDRQWKQPEQFLAWIEVLCLEWKRLLKPNGSLYVFASPQMAARVEVVISRSFHVLNHIIWRKEQGRHKVAHKEGLRSYFPITERIIFAEHYHSDNYALDGSGYAAKCDELRGFVFEPIRAYLDGERKRAGIGHREVIAHLGMTGHDSHFFSPVQWKLPLPEQYTAMRTLFNQRGRKHGVGYLRADYEDLRADYEDLRADYEDLRRPFQVTPDVPYTDVWDFEPVAWYPGKHPCEKPVSLLSHIVQASTRPGALILDCFAGSGSTCEAAQRLGRHYIGIDANAGYVVQARARVAQERRLVALPVKSPVPRKTRQPSKHQQTAEPSAPLPAPIPLASRKRKQPTLPPDIEQLALFG